MFSTAAPPIKTQSTNPFLTQFVGITDIPYESSSVPISSVEHFDYHQEFSGSSTIVGGLAVAQQDSQLNWWELSDASFAPFIESYNSPSATTPPTTTTDSITKNDPDDWSVFDKTTTLPVSYSNHLSDPHFEHEFDMNDYFNITQSTTPATNFISHNSASFVPSYFEHFKPNEPTMYSLEPMPTLSIPPFSWMLQLASQNGIKNRKIISNTTRKSETKKRSDAKIIKNISSNDPHEYCNKKQCQNGGRLNKNCVCVCLPVYSGEHCERGNMIIFTRKSIICFLFSEL